MKPFCTWVSKLIYLYANFRQIKNSFATLIQPKQKNSMMRKIQMHVCVDDVILIKGGSSIKSCLSVCIFTRFIWVIGFRRGNTDSL